MKPQWAYELFNEQPPTILLQKQDMELVPQAVLSTEALREVVEGLKRIAEPDQQPLRDSQDCIRLLANSLTMLNAGRAEAQRLLAQLGRWGRVQRNRIDP